MFDFSFGTVSITTWALISGRWFIVSLGFEWSRVEWGRASSTLVFHGTFTTSGQTSLAFPFIGVIVIHIESFFAFVTIVIF